MENSDRHKSEYDLKHWFIVFGTSHTFYPGAFKIYADSEMEARKKAFKIVGNKFSTSYDPIGFDCLPTEDKIIRQVIDSDNSIQEGIVSHLLWLLAQLKETLSYSDQYEKIRDQERIWDETILALARLDSPNRLIQKQIEMTLDALISKV